MSDYPEHERMAEIPEGEREAVARFLEWLDSQGIRLGVYVTDAWGISHLVEWAEGHDPLMHRFWGIDKRKLGEEKDEMVRKLRKP